jgi:hypothetical protein
MKLKVERVGNCKIICIYNAAIKVYVIFFFIVRELEGRGELASGPPVGGVL